MTDIASLIIRNTARWRNAILTRGPEFGPVARRLLAGKPRYEGIAAQCSVPWFVVAVIHEREASGRWDRSIAQGDPWNAVSTHEPRGRGPFKSWEAAAIDALTSCAPHAALWKDWTPGGAMTLLEQYNGLGYANHGVPSPYVWSGTDQYVSGKIVVDHGPIEPVVDKQLGCAGLILALMAIDPSIRFGAPTPIAPPIPVAQATTPLPSSAPPPPPAKTGWLAALISIFIKRG